MGIISVLLLEFWKDFEMFERICQLLLIVVLTVNQLFVFPSLESDICLFILFIYVVFVICMLLRLPVYLNKSPRQQCNSVLF